MPERSLPEEKSATPKTTVDEKKIIEKLAQKKSAKKELVVIFLFSP